MRDISKRFPGVLALDNVSLSIERGEVHALLGENGAGKSTLMKILSGAYKKDAGEIIFDGQPVQINSPRQAQELGVSIIYQELNLVPQLSVAENIFLSSLPMKNPACIDWKRVYSDAQTIIDSLEVDINVRSRISSLGIAQQQMVEIAKALNHQAKVIVMDELGPAEAAAQHFQAAVLAALDGEKPVCGVLQQADSAFLRRVAAHPRVRVVTVTEENRDALRHQLCIEK